jgi:hypothetical protein
LLQGDPSPDDSPLVGVEIEGVGDVSITISKLGMV